MSPSRTASLIAFIASLSMSSCVQEDRSSDENDSQVVACPEGQVAENLANYVARNVSDLFDSDERFNKRTVIRVFEEKEIVYGTDLPSIDNAIKTYAYILGDKPDLIPDGQQVANYINQENFQLIGLESNGINIADFHSKNHVQNRTAIGRVYPSLFDPVWELPLVATNESRTNSRVGFPNTLIRSNETVNINGLNLTRLQYVLSLFSESFRKTNTFKRLNDEDPMLAEEFLKTIVFGLVSLESGYNPNARSNADARGIFQILPSGGPGLLRLANARGILKDVDQNSLNLFSIRDSASIAPFHFDSTYNHLVSTLGSSHPYFKLDQRVQSLMLIQAYNNGQGRAEQIIKYFFNRFPDEARPGFVYFNSHIPSFYFDRMGRLRPDFHFFMISEFFKGVVAGDEGTHKNYRTDSHQYISKILAYKFLFTGESYFLNPPNIQRCVVVSPNDSSSSNDNEGFWARFSDLSTNRNLSIGFVNPEIDSVFRSALNGNFRPNIIESNERPLRGVSVQVSNEVKRYLLHSQNSPNNQVPVFEWFEQNDPFKIVFDNSKAKFSNTTSPEMIDDLVRQGHLINLDKNPVFSLGVRARSNITNNTFTIRIERGDEGIVDSWRRNIRVDHKAILDEIAIRVNKKLYDAGMSKDYFVVPIVSSALRKNAVSGSSRNSLHLWNSALDFMVFAYAVHRKNSDGSISTFPVLEKNEDYLNAVRQVLFEMAKEDKLFPREETRAPHFHIVPRVQQSTNIARETVQTIQERVLSQKTTITPEAQADTDNAVLNEETTRTPKAQADTDNADFEIVLVPNRKLGAWIRELSGGACSAREIRIYNNLPSSPTRDPKTRISPGQYIKIPKNCIK
jgi:hypothetical protein